MHYTYNLLCLLDYCEKNSDLTSVGHILKKVTRRSFGGLF